VLGKESLVCVWHWSTSSQLLRSNISCCCFTREALSKQCSCWTSCEASWCFVILKVDILEIGFNCDDIPLHLVDTILQLWKTTVHRIGFCAGNDLHTEIVAVSWKCRPLSTISFSVQGCRMQLGASYFLNFWLYKGPTFTWQVDVIHTVYIIFVHNKVLLPVETSFCWKAWSSFSADFWFYSLTNVFYILHPGGFYTFLCSFRDPFIPEIALGLLIQECWLLVSAVCMPQISCRQAPTCSRSFCKKWWIHWASVPHRWS